MANKRGSRKIKIVDSGSSIHTRALRVRKVREMAKLTRRVIADKYHINFNTFKGWEVERHGGLTLKGARLLIPILKDNGVWCTAEWLVYGIGSSPRKIDDQCIAVKEERHDDLPVFDEKEDKHIIQGLQMFRAHTPRTLSLIVPDDAVDPYYLKGEYVAGIKRSSKDLKPLLGKICIIQTRTGRIFLRELQPGSKKGCFNLVSTSPNTPMKEPVMKDIAVASAASIIWIRRKNLLYIKAR